LNLKGRLNFWRTTEISRRGTSREIKYRANRLQESNFDVLLESRHHRNYGRMPGHNLLLFYVLLIVPISIVLFLHGFFPVAHHADVVASQSDVPEYVGDLRWVNLKIIVEEKGERFSYFFKNLFNFIWENKKLKSTARDPMLI